MPLKKQFIAGAKCTHCGAQDKVRLCREDGREWIECVACGYSEERPKEVTPHDPPEDEHEEAAAGAVRWLPGKTRGTHEH